MNCTGALRSLSARGMHVIIMCHLRVDHALIAFLMIIVQYNDVEASHSEHSQEER